MEQQSNERVFQTAFSLSNQTDVVPGTGIQLQNWRCCGPPNGDPLATIPPPSHDLNGGTPASPGATGRIMDPNYRNPVTEEWNGGYTWALTSKSAIEAEYVHVLSLHENKNIKVDPPHPIHPAKITTPSPTETGRNSASPRS